MGSLLGRLNVISRGTACVLAGIPSTIFIPLPITRLFLKRYKHEDLLRNIHLMVSWAHFCRKYILKVDLQVWGSENVPKPSRGHMYISNHQSWVDILVLGEALNTMAFLSKTLIRDIPILGMSAYAAGGVWVDRKIKNSRQHALLETLRMCEESTAVVSFPEGTRSSDGNLRPKVHLGAIKAAYNRGLKIIPIGLDGTFGVVPKSMDAVNYHRKVVVSIGEPMNPQDYSDAETWSLAVWDQVKNIFAQSRELVTAAD